jgi:hypothetical protein
MQPLQLKEAGVDLSSSLTTEKKAVALGGYPVPPEMSALIQIGQIAVPMLIGVIALWAAKGRRSDGESSLKFSWTKDGIHFERVTIEKKSASDTSDQISAALSSGLTKLAPGQDDNKLDSKSAKNDGAA